MSGVDRDHITVKAIIIGDSGTGKSSLLHRFTENTYTEDHAQTIGVEFAQKVINVVGRKVKLQVWDTAGQERYRSVTRSYYRGSACCIVCYDLTRHDSFLHIDDWLKDATTLAEKGAKLVLVGNKKDLASRKREVPFADAAAYAQRHGMKFLETSAYLGEGVEEAFHLAVKCVIDGEQGGKPAGGGNQSKKAHVSRASPAKSTGNKNKKESGGCC